MIDLVTLVPIVASAIGGAAANELRTRRAARTAARLIHAELLECSANIRYYRSSGSLLEPRFQHAAWDKNGDALARMRDVKAFEAITRGYRALEAVAYIAKSASPDGRIAEDLSDILEEAIPDVCAALRTAGGLARISSEAAIAEMSAAAPRQRAPLRLVSRVVGEPVIPAYLLDTIGGVGSQAQRQAARQTRQQLAKLQKDTSEPPAAAGAEDGAPAASRTVGAQGLRRVILDASSGQDLAGARVVRAEGDPPTGDSAADDAYDGLGVTYDFFMSVYGRDSIDGAGLELRAVVNYGRNFNNAFWDGREVVFGNGDGELFLPFTRALDLIARDFTYGVVQHERPLQYLKEPGALTVSIADVFGSLVKQYHNRQKADEADWLIGAGIFGPKVKGGTALRSLKAPGSAYDDPLLGKDPNAAHLRDFVRTDQDNGGIHINCGIPNHAFYLAAAAMGGFAWERAGHIWYQTLFDPGLAPTTRFKTFARATVRTAKRLYGDSSDEAAAARHAWEQVGVSLQTSRAPRSSSI
jgi:Thermolysin metallopeptidase, alpha-helical domain/Thermolysin metallopeptidase, catalytic domain